MSGTGTALGNEPAPDFSLIDQNLRLLLNTFVAHLRVIEHSPAAVSVDQHNDGLMIDVALHGRNVHVVGTPDLFQFQQRTGKESPPALHVVGSRVCGLVRDLSRSRIGIDTEKLYLGRGRWGPLQGS